MTRFPRQSEADRKAESDRRMQAWRDRIAEQKRQLDREASGEATGMRYAIECRGLWVGADDRCSNTEPIVFAGDRDSAQGRAGRHALKNERGGGVHHSACITPEDQIARRVSFHKIDWRNKS